ncbi:hypothetical protein [Blautia sp. HCN-1074]|uniref:hypothetical protein n=1 Tax=Blautia sp. HCN-1074 TaxID=3134667 RepID=UPI001A9A46B6
MLLSVDVDICVTVPSSFTVISLAYIVYEDSIGDVVVMAAIATDIIRFIKLFIVPLLLVYYIFASSE